MEFDAFSVALRHYRDRRRLSQSRLAEAAGFDHSYVSRLESGGRVPSREAVIKLATAMKLESADRDALLMAAGFTAIDEENLFAAEPVLSMAFETLRKGGLPTGAREDLRMTILLATRQAQRVERVA